MGRDLAGIEEGNPLSRGPSGPLRSSKSGKPEAKRMRRDPVVTDHNIPLSRGPSGPLRSSKSGKQTGTSAEGTLLATETSNAQRMERDLAGIESKELVCLLAVPSL